MVMSLLQSQRLYLDGQRVHRLHLDRMDLLAGEYNARLQRRQARVHSVFLEELERLPSMRTDAEEDEEEISDATRAAILLALARTFVRVQEEGDPQVAFLEQLFGQADRATTRKTRLQIARALPGAGMGEALVALPAADPTALRQNFIRSNVGLIKSIDARYFGEIRELVNTGHAEGKSTRWLTQQIQQRYDVSKSRATLIARDQLGKLPGQLALVRNLELGVEMFQWLTAGDERVRREHERLAGRIFRWEQPPPVGLPGTPIQCRCGSVPVLDQQHAAQLISLAEARAQRLSPALARSPIVTGEIVPVASRAISRRRVEEFAGQFRRAA